MSKSMFILIMIFAVSTMIFANDNSVNELVLRASVGSKDFGFAFICFGISLLVRGGKK